MCCWNNNPSISPNSAGLKYSVSYLNFPTLVSSYISITISQLCGSTDYLICSFEICSDCAWTYCSSICFDYSSHLVSDFYSLLGPRHDPTNLQFSSQIPKNYLLFFKEYREPDHSMVILSSLGSVYLKVEVFRLII